MEGKLHEIAEQFPTISDTALLDPTQVRCSNIGQMGSWLTELSSSFLWIWCGAYVLMGSSPNVKGQFDKAFESQLHTTCHPVAQTSTPTKNALGTGLCRRTGRGDG